MYKVFLRGLEFYAYHGVPDAEQTIGHRYSLDLELTVTGKADITDAVTDTVDYGTLAIELASLGAKLQFRTVERLACVLGEHVLEHYPSVQDVEIEVSKLLPPAPVIMAEAGVRLLLSRVN
jgi:dihydroneopterin aldolase